MCESLFVIKAYEVIKCTGAYKYCWTQKAKTNQQRDSMTHWCVYEERKVVMDVYGEV